MKTILVVDDDKTNLISAKNALDDLYNIVPVSSGLQALKYLETHICDLILLDIDMPDMDGFEVMDKIREMDDFKKVPIILLADDNEAATETKCLEAGAMDFIAKPFVPMVMLSRIERILLIEYMRKQLADKLEKKIEEVNDIKSKSNQDALTGLWNRKYTENKVNEYVENGMSGSLFMIDMDNFKAINDNYGHIEGDNTLKMFADTMRDFATEKDVLCRIGGDEFVMFLNGRTSKDEVGKTARAIISDLCRKIDEKNFNTNSSVSIGISQIPEDAEDFNTAYNAADKALYYVKQNGKNSYHFFSEQKAAEAARGNTLVDLKYLKEIMSRADSGNGAYKLDLDSFQHVYNFIRRSISRSGRNVQTILFTAITETILEQEEIDDALDILEQAIFSSLRRSDVSTRYSNKQVIVILLDADFENGDFVAKRIIDCFHEIYSGSVEIRYDIAKMESRTAT